jgi:uroporphyrinogen-III decarboxylase
MEDLIPFFVRLAASIYQAGAVAIAIPCGYVSPHIVPRKMVQRLMLPILTKAFNSLKGAVILHHGGGPILAHLDLLFSLPNVIAVLIDPRDSIASTRNLIGNQQTLITGLMAPRFLDFTSHQIEEGCEKVLEACRMDRRFILANAGPDLPWNTPIENILAMRRVVERWGPLK